MTDSAFNTELWDTNTSDGSINGLFWVLDSTGVLLVIACASVFPTISLSNTKNKKNLGWKLHLNKLIIINGSRNE